MHRDRTRFDNATPIDVRGIYVTPELNNELQCNVGNMWEKFTLHLYALKPLDVSTAKVYFRFLTSCNFNFSLSDVWKN